MYAGAVAHRTLVERAKVTRHQSRIMGGIGCPDKDMGHWDAAARM